MNDKNNINLPDVILNPEIESNKNEIVSSIYNKLYRQFFEAQIPKSPSFPHGIEVGDRLDISLKNSAFSFAKTMGEAIEIGASGVEVDVSNLVKKDGDTMTGELSAIRGFKAGKNGQVILEVLTNDEGIHYVNIASILNISGDGLRFDGDKVIFRNSESKTTTISDKSVIVDAENTTILNGATIGGITVDSGGVIKNKDGQEFYSPKNSNKDDVDWHANNIYAKNNANVGGDVSISGKLTSGDANIAGNVSITKDSMSVLSPVHIDSILYIGEHIFAKKTEDGVSVGASNGNLIIGNDETKSIKLAKPIKTWDGKYSIITETGFGNFQGGFSASHNRSSPIIKTFYNSPEDKGVIIDNKISFLGSKDVSLHEADGGLMLDLDGDYVSIKTDKSSSYYKPRNKDSKTTFIESSADFIAFGKPVEASSFTIKNKSTQLKDRVLNLGDGAMIEGGKNKMTLHSNVIVKNNISSERFADGFSGYGWAIKQDSITGVTRITTDEITVRNKMNIYELNVRKIKSSNGAIWVSDSMVGGNVQQII